MSENVAYQVARLRENIECAQKEAKGLPVQTDIGDSDTLLNELDAALQRVNIIQRVFPEDSEDTTVLASELKAFLGRVHNALENDIGACLGGIAGGCGACALCRFDDSVADMLHSMDDVEQARERNRAFSVNKRVEVRHYKNNQPYLIIPEQHVIDVEPGQRVRVAYIFEK